MKMTKKWLLAAAALALVFSFASCKEEDDEEGAINGEAATYDNSGNATIYRAYSSTRLKHLGALVKIELKDQNVALDTKTTTAGYNANGVLGLIWDIQSTKKAAAGQETADDDVSVDETAGVAKNALNFLIAGLKYNRTDRKVQYYVSKFYDITNVNDQNFGAWNTSTDSAVKVTTNDGGLAATVPSELVVQDTWGDVGGTVNPDTNGSVFVWVDIYPAQATHKDVTPVTASASDDAVAGAYVIDFYLGEDQPAAGTKPAAETIVKAGNDGTGYSEQPAQAKIARYLNTYPYAKMNGVITYENTYAEAEVVEDAE